MSTDPDTERHPLQFRSRELVFGLVAAVYNDERGQIRWLELIARFDEAHAWKTVERVIYELLAAGIFHRVGAPPKHRAAADTRALRPTPLGRAWMRREVADLLFEED